MLWHWATVREARRLSRRLPKSSAAVWGEEHGPFASITALCRGRRKVLSKGFGGELLFMANASSKKN